MAIATINGITVELSISELIELANCQTQVERTVESVTQKASKPKSAPKPTTNSKPVSNSETGIVEITALCGHSFTKTGSARGRKPSLCPDCKGETGEDHNQGGNGDSEPKNKRQDGGNKGGGRYSPKPLDEMPDDVDATDNQITRITLQLKERKLTSKDRKNYEAEIAEGVSVRRAAEIYRTLKKLPLA